jgi:hypothetical protein
MLHTSDTGIAGWDPTRSMDVCPRLSVLVQVLRRAYHLSREFYKMINSFRVDCKPRHARGHNPRQLKKKEDKSMALILVGLQSNDVWWKHCSPLDDRT